MATAKKTTTFGVTCPHCGDREATLSIDLANVEVITCSSCDQAFDVHHARDLAAAELDRWQRVVAWVEAASAILAAPSTE